MEPRGCKKPGYLIRNVEEFYKTNMAAEICMLRSSIYICYLSERCDCSLSVK